MRYESLDKSTERVEDVHNPEPRTGLFLTFFGVHLCKGDDEESIYGLDIERTVAFRHRKVCKRSYVFKTAIDHVDSAMTEIGRVNARAGGPIQNSKPGVDRGLGHKRIPLDLHRNRSGPLNGRIPSRNHSA